MVERLSLGEQPVSSMAAPFRMSLTAALKHVRVLEEAGVIRTRKLGRQRWCSLDAQALEDADGWLRSMRRFWAKQLDQLAEHVERGEEGRDKEAP